MNKTNDMNEKELQALFDEATSAAKEAEKKFIEQYGEPMFCGFAWVNVTPGTSRLAKWLVKNEHAHKSYRGGVDVWNPGGSFTQSMDIKMAGAAAFAEVLKKYGVDAVDRSRPD